MGVSAYTMIRTGDGTEKRAEDLTPGDVVFDPVSNMPVSLRKVWQGPAVGMYRLALDNGLSIDLTEDHLVLAETGLLAAKDVAPGAAVRMADGFARCIEAAPLLGDYMVYDLVAETDGGVKPCMLANGVIAGM